MLRTRNQKIAYLLFVVATSGASFLGGRWLAERHNHEFCQDHGYLGPHAISAAKGERKIVDFPGGQVAVEIEVEAVRVGD